MMKRRRKYGTARGDCKIILNFIVDNTKKEIGIDKIAKPIIVMMKIGVMPLSKKEGFVMEWSLLYSDEKPPTFEQVANYIDCSLWSEMNHRLQTVYQIEPVMEYSHCSMQRGWNMKYKKSGKSLCTLYPMPGYFIALVVIGNKEMQEAELLIPRCSSYVQDVFKNTKSGQGQKWLMIDVRDTEMIDDSLALISLRKKPQKADNAKKH